MCVVRKISKNRGSIVAGPTVVDWGIPEKESHVRALVSSQRKKKKNISLFSITELSHVHCFSAHCVLDSCLEHRSFVRQVLRKDQDTSCFRLAWYWAVPRFGKMKCHSSTCTSISREKRPPLPRKKKKKERI